MILEDSSGDLFTEQMQKQQCNPLVVGQQIDDCSIQLTELYVTPPDRRPCRQTAALAGEQQ